MWTLVADCSLRDLLSVVLRYFFLMPVAKEGREDCQSWKQGRAQCLLSVLWDWWKSFGSDVHPLPLMKKHPTGSTGAEVGARCDGGWWCSLIMGFIPKKEYAFWFRKRTSYTQWGQEFSLSPPLLCFLEWSVQSTWLIMYLTMRLW